MPEINIDNKLFRRNILSIGDGTEYQIRDLVPLG